MEKKTYITKLKYDGRNYSGWRRQKHQPETIQQIVEDTLRAMTGLKVNLHAASWTDAGVHAEGQVAAMVLRSKIDTLAFMNQANTLLPDDIMILSVDLAPRGFDPIGGNIGKHYRYAISAPGIKCDSGRCWQLDEQLDVDIMQNAANKLVGTHDFRGIRQSKDRRSNCVRTITSCSVSSGADMIYIDFHGDNFIYLMIRSLTAALVDIATGSKPLEYIQQLLSSEDNRFCPVPAPAQGLTLVEVKYPV